jgi:hypothetical protein
MDLAARIAFLKGAIASQQNTLRVQVGLAIALFALGITVVILGLVNPGLVLAESLKGGQTLGGAVVAASGFVPIRSSRREKVQALQLLLAQYEVQQREGPDPEPTKKLDQYFDQYFGKVLGG